VCPLSLHCTQECARISSTRGVKGGNWICCMTATRGFFDGQGASTPQQPDRPQLAGGVVVIRHSIQPDPLTSQRGEERSSAGRRGRAKPAARHTQGLAVLIIPLTPLFTQFSPPASPNPTAASQHKGGAGVDRSTRSFQSSKQRAASARAHDGRKDTQSVDRPSSGYRAERHSRRSTTVMRRTLTTGLLAFTALAGAAMADQGDSVRACVRGCMSCLCVCLPVDQLEEEGVRRLIDRGGSIRSGLPCVKCTMDRQQRRDRLIWSWAGLRSIESGGGGPRD
jgi:hypothetical protein